VDLISISVEALPQDLARSIASFLKTSIKGAVSQSVKISKATNLFIFTD